MRDYMLSLEEGINKLRNYCKEPPKGRTFSLLTFYNIKIHIMYFLLITTQAYQTCSTNHSRPVHCTKRWMCFVLPRTKQKIRCHGTSNGMQKISQNKSLPKPVKGQIVMEICPLAFLWDIMLYSTAGPCIMMLWGSPCKNSG